MTPENFCYWLQGYFELCSYDKNNELSSHQIKVIKDHLKLVFTKETPVRVCVPPIKRAGPYTVDHPFINPEISYPVEAMRLCSTQVGQCSTESPYPVDQVAVASFRDINNEPSC